MKVTIVPGKPTVRQNAEGGNVHHYPINVRAEGKGVQRVTLSANGSQVAEGATGNLNHALNGGDYEPGTVKLFASATDGTETVTTELPLSHNTAPATPAKQPPPAPSGSQMAPQK